MSERYVGVVCRLGCASLCGRLGLRRLRILIVLLAEKLELVSDDLSDPPLDPLLVLVLSRAQAAFDVDRIALSNVLADDLGEAAESGDAVPLRFRLSLTGLVSPLASRCDREGGDGEVSFANLGILTDVAEDDYLVNGCRCFSLVRY